VSCQAVRGRVQGEALTRGERRETASAWCLNHDNTRLLIAGSTYFQPGVPPGVALALAARPRARESGRGGNARIKRVMCYQAATTPRGVRRTQSRSRLSWIAGVTWDWIVLGVPSLPCVGTLNQRVMPSTNLARTCLLLPGLIRVDRVLAARKLRLKGRPCS
jgi:hypothetical protein